MGQAVLIYGKSGSGKSRSLKNFDEDEIFLINIEGKLLPFHKKFKYTANIHNYELIKSQLSKMPLKTAVIDDAGYLMTNTFMYGHSKGMRGNEVYDLYNDIADEFWLLIKFIKEKLHESVIVYIIMHEDITDAGETKLRTIGKLLDSKVCIEGMVTVCLQCASENGRHFFRTVTTGHDITKAPEEMFESSEIDNDLKFVDETIRNYYGLNESEETEK